MYIGFFSFSISYFLLFPSSPLPRLETERLLDTLALTIKRQVNPEQTSEIWFSQAARVIIKLIWGYSWTPKLQKKIIKVSYYAASKSSFSHGNSVKGF